MANARGGNSALTQTLQGNNKPAQASPAKTIEAYLKKMAPTFAQVLPKHVNEDRLLRIALTTIRTNPKLLQCEMPSLMAAVMQSAQLGLEPGLLGHCYIIPYGKEATFIIGYKGMIDLARRSGNILDIRAREVYENDYFEITYGLVEELKHIPWFARHDEKFTEPGEFIGAYVVAELKDARPHIHYMPKYEIDKHRTRSKSGSSGPWQTDYIEMAKKTVVRSAWKWLPISIEIAEQVERSDGSVRPEPMAEPVEFIDIPNETNEEVTAAAESAVTIESDDSEPGPNLGGDAS